MPYTPPEKPSQIDLTEKIDRAEFVRRCEASIAECTREMSLASVAMAMPNMTLRMQLVSLVWQVKIPRIGALIENAKSCTHEAQLTIFENARESVMQTIHADDVRALFPLAPRAQLTITKQMLDRVSEMEVVSHSIKQRPPVDSVYLADANPGSGVALKRLHDEMIERFGKTVSSMYVDTATAAVQSPQPHGKTALMMNEAFEAALQGKQVVVCTARGNIEIEKAAVHAMRGRKLDLVIIDDVHRNQDADFFAMRAKSVVSSVDLFRSDADRAMRERPVSGLRRIEAKFASTCPECQKNIDVGDAAMWKPGHLAIHFACARVPVDPRVQFRVLVEIAQGRKLEACAKAVGTVRLHTVRTFNPVTGLTMAADSWESDVTLRGRIIKRLEEGHAIAPFTYTEKL